MNILTYLFIVLSLFTSILIPLKARACSFPFDLLSCFSGTKEVDADTKATNSQNMALLQAAISPNPEVSQQADIAIVGGTSLLADAQGSSGQKVASSTSDQISLYVVHKGDTLADIAKMFGVSKNTIVWANDLQGKSISVGQTLVILPISGVQHTVKKGDTLQSIAKKYKADLEEILQFNNLSADSKLAIGDEILIPDGEVTPTTSSSSSGSSKPNNSGVGTKGPSTPVYDGYYMRPIIGGVKTQGIHGHNGVDLASSYGSNILASASGTVIIAKSSGWNGGYGEYVVISHPNGTQTLYGHMSLVSVSVGDQVEQGQIIGHMGSTGKSTGVHVHFEIRGARNPF